MKFIGVPVRVREASHLLFTPKGTLPVLRDGEKVLTNFEEVVDYLKSLVRIFKLLNAEKHFIEGYS